MREGRVLQYLWEKVREEGAVHLTLLDPDKAGDLSTIEKLCHLIRDAGSDAVLIGGSTGVVEHLVDEVVKVVKEVTGLPTILFPGSVAGLSRYADAVLFLSVLNSVDPYFITGAQAQAAVMIRKRYRNLEVIPTAYILMGEGGAAAYVAAARPIPYSRPELAAAYALAAEYMGMRVVYLEAGSGAREPIPPQVISTVREALSEHMFLVVGGGIRSGELAERAVKAGAQAVVTGTVVELEPEKLRSIVEGVKRGGKRFRS